MKLAGMFRAILGTPYKITYSGQTGSELFSLGCKVLADKAGKKVLQLTYDLPLDGNSLVGYQLVVSLTGTPCSFGGSRSWFRCPGVRPWAPCGSRVAILYLPPGQARFACRRCWNLTYASVKSHNPKLDRLARRPEELVRALRSNKLGEALMGVRAAMKVLQRARRGHVCPQKCTL